MNRDQLSVEGLRLRCQLGTERPDTMMEQDIVVTFTLYTDLSKASRSDTLADTVDLARVVTSVRTYAACTAHELLESLALEIARILLTDFPIHEASVTVRKPGAFPDADAQSVTLTRQRAHFKAPAAPPAPVKEG